MRKKADVTQLHRMFAYSLASGCLNGYFRTNYFSNFSEGIGEAIQSLKIAQKTLCGVKRIRILCNYPGDKSSNLQ